eukprot:Skav215180  [mRNA]  locus=scaffold3330:14608:14787:- [translate_table: standard]
MDSAPLSDLLPWKVRDPAKDTFWDLHRRLGECPSAATSDVCHTDTLGTCCGRWGKTARL